VGIGPEFSLGVATYGAQVMARACFLCFVRTKAYENSEEVPAARSFLVFYFFTKNTKRQHANPGEGFIFLL
jgi:hypothetical protein